MTALEITPANGKLPKCQSIGIIEGAQAEISSIAHGSIVQQVQMSACDGQNRSSVGFLNNGSASRRNCRSGYLLSVCPGRC